MSTARQAGADYEMREPCRWCGAEFGFVVERNGQDTVRCGACDRHCYNAPRVETGKRTLNLQERTGIRPSIRARILREWDNRCGFCGVEAHNTPQGGLHLAHLVDRELAERYGLLDALIDDPINIVPACQDCNLGERSLEPKHLRLIVRFMLIDARRRAEV